MGEGVEADQGAIDRQHRVGLANLSSRRHHLLAAHLGKRPLQSLERAPDAEVDIAHAIVALTQGLAAAESARRLGTSKASVDRRWAPAIGAQLDGFAPG